MYDVGRPMPARSRKPSAKRTARGEMMLGRARALRRRMTMPERVLWNLLRRNQLGVKFRRQHVVGRFVADFYCQAARLCVEVDGRSHDRSNEDRARDAYMRACGIEVMRFAASEFPKNRFGVRDTIKRKIDERMRGSPVEEGG